MGGGFYGYRLKFWLFHGYRLQFFSVTVNNNNNNIYIYIAQTSI